MECGDYVASDCGAPLRGSLAIGNGGVGQLLMTSDAAVYVQGYGVTQSALFLVKGTR